MSAPNSSRVVTNVLTDLGSVVRSAKYQFGSSVVSRADVGDIWLILDQDLCATEVAELQIPLCWGPEVSFAA